MYLHSRGVGNTEISEACDENSTRDQRRHCHSVSAPRISSFTTEHKKVVNKNCSSSSLLSGYNIVRCYPISDRCYSYRRLPTLISISYLFLPSTFRGITLFQFPRYCFAICHMLLDGQNVSY